MCSLHKPSAVTIHAQQQSSHYEGERKRGTHPKPELTPIKHRVPMDMQRPMAGVMWLMNSAVGADRFNWKDGILEFGSTCVDLKCVLDLQR